MFGYLESLLNQRVVLDVMGHGKGRTTCTVMQMLVDKYGAAVMVRKDNGSVVVFKLDAVQAATRCK